MLYFATYFDINYLTRGLALLHSLKSHSSEPLTLYILALDKQINTYFEKFDNDNVVIISIDAFESYFPELSKIKDNRSKIEYYFTLSPFLPLYILETFNEVDQITTMDADLYFFDDPAIILRSYPQASILITPHNFSPSIEDRKKYGRYNVSFQSFKKNKEGLACLKDWKERCLEWCYDYLDEKNNRYADQKYLDTWNERYKISEINIPGAGLAPWNIEKYSYRIINNKIFVNDHPLIYYHFHHLRIFNKNFALNALLSYKVDVTRKAIRVIYHTYLKKLRLVAKSDFHLDDSIKRYSHSSNQTLIHKVIEADGYWLFTHHFITHVNHDFIRRVNLLAYLAKVKKILKSLWLD